MVTEINNYKCPILNREIARYHKSINADVLVQLSVSKPVGIICPEYLSSTLECKTRKQESKDNPNEKMSKLCKLAEGFKELKETKNDN